MIGLREDQQIKARLVARINQLLGTVLQPVKPVVVFPASKGAG